jgi:pimeloyl-ACP methyl ester carboxylesterase
MWRAADDAFAGGDLERCVEIELAAWVDGVGRPAGTLPPAIREQARQMIRRTWERLRADGEPMDETPLVPPREERLGEVAVPTLVVVGELDQPDVLACCRELPKRIPGATLAVLPNAAHLPPLEQPVAFTSLLEAWLRRHRG